MAPVLYDLALSRDGCLHHDMLLSQFLAQAEALMKGRDSDEVMRTALHTAHCTLHTAHCTLHTANCTLHTAHCALHIEHRTLDHFINNDNTIIFWGQKTVGS